MSTTTVISINRSFNIEVRETALGILPTILVIGSTVGIAILTGCQSVGTTAPATNATPTAGAIPAPTNSFTSVPAAPGGLGVDGYLLLNQRLVEGLYVEELDLGDVDEVFWYIFSRLPGEVTVYPSENYFYYILYVGGQQIWGNIRLPTGRRERGVLSFAYFEFIEFPSVPGRGISQAKFFTEADGLRIDEIDPFKWRVTYDRRSVIFNLHKLSQEPPKSFPLGEDEVFVERTFDESGYQFFLLFNEKRNYFFWVLNEEDGGVSDVLDPIEDDLVVGKRSGFAFWIDEAHGGRKVLAAIRRLSVTRNDYFDGPFDQLADNYVDEVNISEYMKKWNPSLEGRIDKYGYYTDTVRPLRVAISAYGTYFTIANLQEYMERARVADDPYQFIARGGVPLPVTPTPELSPLPTP